MSFRIKDLMVDVAPARFAGQAGCPNSGPPGTADGCPNSGPTTGDERGGCPNSGGPTATCPDDNRKGCPNSGPGTTRSPGRKARAGSAADLPELRRQLHEALSASASAQAWV